MEGSQCYELPACPSQLYTYPIPRIPVLVSHELSKSEFAFNRQNPDLLMDREQISNSFSQFHMENGQVCQIFQSSACMVDKRTLK